MEKKGVVEYARGLGLCAAAASGHMDIINLLLEHGWDQMEPPKGSSPLLFAIASPNMQPAIVELFLQRCWHTGNTWIGRGDGIASYCLLGRYWDSQIFSPPRSKRGGQNQDQGKTPLYVASRNAYSSDGLKAVRALLNAAQT